MIHNERIEIADKVYECNACLWVAVYLEDTPRDTGIRFSEWRAIIEAKKYNGNIMPGQEMRVYE